MNNENLKPFNTMSSEQRKNIQSKGGYARAKKIKELKNFKDKFDKITKDKSLQDILMKTLIDKAKSGDISAIKALLDTSLKLDYKDNKEEDKFMSLLLRAVKAGVI